MKWQPIETAPKDGTPVFIMHCGKPVPAAWDSRTYEWRWNFLHRGKPDALREAGVKQWHPMSLPEPPTNAEKEQEVE